jgi:hypothetical protein
MDSGSTPSSVLRTYGDAWLKSDHETMFDMYADDIVAHYGGGSIYSGTHVGKPRFLDVLVESSLNAQRSLVSIDALFDTGSIGAIFTTESMVVGGERRTLARALRFRINKGKIVECWLYDQDQHVTDAAWSA